jgi:hypothetical protein
VFLLGFVMAMGAGWWWFGRNAAAPAPVAGDGPALRADELEGFFRTVAEGDYPAIKERGEALFRPGARVADADRLLAPYAVNSFPPYTVYALYTFNNPDLTRRVLLTLDEGDRVESFLAEEMAVIK